MISIGSGDTRMRGTVGAAVGTAVVDQGTVGAAVGTAVVDQKTLPEVRATGRSRRSSDLPNPQFEAEAVSPVEQRFETRGPFLRVRHVAPKAVHVVASSGTQHGARAVTRPAGVENEGVVACLQPALIDDRLSL